MATLEKDPATCDICLLLEGTYPYVKGGVSGWVHELVSGLPQWRFAAVFLGSRRVDYGDIQYPPPGNLTQLKTYYLFDDSEPERPRTPRLPADTLDRYRSFHDQLRSSRELALPLHDLLSPEGAYGKGAFLYSPEAWRYITEAYEIGASEPSFVDYFWTIRNMHRPIWTVGAAAEALPKARLFFSPSTGYAGLLGIMGAKNQDRPFILMEHGIYTKERRIDLLNADWIADTRSALQRDITETSYLRELWIRFFEILGRQAYLQADPIISLFEAARRQQVLDGAETRRTRIIPNGVEIARFAPLRRPAGSPIPPVACLIGRVVSIKDIKTFIRAIRILRDQLPHAEAWIVGPEDEDPEYSRECHELAAALGLMEGLRFFGFQQIDDFLPRIGVLVLSSISEGLPLSILEGFAAGIPCVTTDVGACAELILGREDSDRALGAAGILVDMADYQGLAAACARLLSSPEDYALASKAAIDRVERYYDRTRMLDAFDRLFAEQVARPEVSN